jgi:Enoyl-(Acyl carrier protein) reductase
VELVKSQRNDLFEAIHATGLDPCQFKWAEDAAETIVESTIVGRRATVEEIANICAFLASDQARFVTGVAWVVDGGTGISRGLPGRLAHIPALPLTLPVRHSLGGFERSIGEKPGEAG